MILDAFALLNFVK